MLSIYTGTLSKCVPNPSSFILLEQNTASFIASAAATSSAPIVNCAVSPCSPTLKLTGAFARKTIYDEIDLPSPELLPSLLRKMQST